MNKIYSRLDNYIRVTIFSLLITFLFFTVNPVAAKEDLLQQLKHTQKQTGVGAVAYALVENHRIIATGGIGQYALDNTRQVTSTSLFRIGSITKTFTALAVMHLVEKGKLQLDQAVKNIVHDVPLENPWPETPVTLAMVLEHTAGLQDLTRAEFNYPKPLSLKQAFKINPEARRLHWPPGYHFSYTNVGAGYAGRAIETVTGENYDSWFEREILGALNMQDSQLHWTKELEKSLVSGYDANLKTRIPYWHTLFRPFGGLNTTAMDMAKFLLLFTDKSKTKNLIVSTAAIQRMETPKTSLAAKAGLKTGYGLGLRSAYFKGHKIYGHEGDGDGYLAKFAYSKESHRGYFIVINAFRNDLLEKFTGLLDGWLIDELNNNDKAVANLAINPLSRKRQLAYVGDYQEVAIRFPFRSDAQAELLRIKLIDKELHRCFPQAKKCTKMLPITENLFRNREESDASISLIETLDGCIYLQASFGSYQKISDQCNHHE